MAKASKIKNTIINDPIYGFISIPHGILNSLVSHSYFQRLRRIKQLGLTHLVYPGGYHNRFQHALGSMHLMGQAIEVLRSKGNEITLAEETGALIAILLHDIGHGPFSHALENSIVKNVTHEDLSELFMQKMNIVFKGELDLAIDIFENKYRKKFLHQLVSSQLDVDRLDYLKRDSFFTGVSEGVISSDRIIKTLNVVNDKLVVEAKGIYSVESFLIARRLMYWQVYLHKTVIAAEYLLIKILQRAKEISNNGGNLFATPCLLYFLNKNCTRKDFMQNDEVLEKFAQLDDYDIFASVKTWVNADDPILARLSSALVNRKLFHIEIQDKPFSKTQINKYRISCSERFKITKKNAEYFVFTDQISNSAYNPGDEKINILYKNGDLVDVVNASDQLNVSVLSKRVRKYFLCIPKELKKHKL